MRVFTLIWSLLQLGAFFLSACLSADAKRKTLLVGQSPLSPVSPVSPVPMPEWPSGKRCTLLSLGTARKSRLSQAARMQ